MAVLSLLIVVVIVIRRYEKIVLLQEVCYILADRSTNEETKHNATDDAQKTEWRSFRFGQYRSGWSGYRGTQVRVGCNTRLPEGSHAMKQRRHSVQQHPLFFFFTFFTLIPLSLFIFMSADDWLMTVNSTLLFRNSRAGQSQHTHTHTSIHYIRAHDY